MRTTEAPDMPSKRRSILPPEQLSGESGDLYDAVNGEADLPCVLISVSAIDKALESLLSRFLIEGETSKNMFVESSGTLGTFADRYKLAYCLGLIPTVMLRNLMTLGSIRNTFAHSHLAITFRDPYITSLCEKLVLPTITQQVTVGDVPQDSSPSANPFYLAKKPRDKFTIASILIFGRLVLAGLGMERSPQCSWSW
jgi:DNA-binding MltR family transcriptional regulator